MHCSDLERYLEACLDGQLGESRRQALKDHLAVCGSCRERVDGLRRFEAELQRRLRSMRHAASLWEPLGLETVAGPGPMPGPDPKPAPRAMPLALPPMPAAAGGTAGGARAALRRGHRLRMARADAAASGRSATVGRRLQNLAGVALVVAAVGAVIEIAIAGLDWLSSDSRAAVYRSYVDGGVELDLRTAEAGRLAVWLGEQLGAPVTLPRAPGGFALVGGKAAPEGLPDGTALAVYATTAGPAILVIQAAGSVGPAAAVGVADPEIVLEDGLARLDWQEGGHAYSLIGALPPEKLALFAD